MLDEGLQPERENQKNRDSEEEQADFVTEAPVTACARALCVL